MIQFIRFFFLSESGATAIEYAVIATGILVAIIVAVQFLGGNVSNMFNDVAAYVTGQ